MCDVNLTLLSSRVSTVADLTPFYLPTESDISHIQAHAHAQAGMHAHRGPFLAVFCCCLSLLTVGGGKNNQVADWKNIHTK